MFKPYFIRFLIIKSFLLGQAPFPSKLAWQRNFFIARAWISDFVEANVDKGQPTRQKRDTDTRGREPPPGSLYTGSLKRGRKPSTEFIHHESW
ncbi:hypothetical protein [Ktedonospora formicarum]|uniref:hypothetical protein n=1 Tax=Ktedonospora formicarum TaxID=2778364 RepID=UPI001C69426E|nr:hypothetical protein [Ktedonospora formicarum]